MEQNLVMRPRRARREERRVMDEEAEREASAYVETAMAFAGFDSYVPRLTVVSSATRRGGRLQASEPGPSSELVDPIAVRPAPVIPIGLPEGATLPPISEPRASVTPLPVRAPEPLVATAVSRVERHAAGEKRSESARPRSSASSSVTIMLGLGFLVFGVALTRRRRRRSWSRS
jgi:hypothetical protein